MWNRIRNIWFKEIMDSLRDKKALRQAILMPVIMGVFYAVLNPMLNSAMQSKVETQSAQVVQVTTIGSDNVDQGLAAIMLAGQIELEEWDGTRAELEAVVEAGDLKLALIVPQGFGERVDGEGSAELELLRNTGGAALNIDTTSSRLRGAIGEYSQQLVAARLAERGVDLEILTPITVNTTTLTTPEQAAGQQAGLMLPILIAVVVVQGGMFVAIDVTAGEKERGTLESLLLTPATDQEIFIGKLMAVITATLIPLILTFIAYGTASNLLPESISGGAKLPLIVIGGSVLIALPLVLAVDVVLMVVAIRTRTFKDAQAAATPVMLGTMFPMMAAGFLPAKNALFAMIPAYGTGLVASKLANEGAIPWGLFAISALGSLLMALAGILLARKLFNRERLLYAA